MPLPAWIYVEKWNVHKEELASAGIIRARSGCRLLTLWSGVGRQSLRCEGTKAPSLVGCRLHVKVAGSRCTSHFPTTCHCGTSVPSAYAAAREIDGALLQVLAHHPPKKAGQVPNREVNMHFRSPKKLMTAFTVHRSEYIRICNTLVMVSSEQAAITELKILFGI